MRRRTYFRRGRDAPRDGEDSSMRVEPSGYMSVNSLGLGHAARAIAIAREMQRRHPRLYLFFLAGAPALDLAVSHGFDAMPLPPTPEWFHEGGHIHSMSRWY